MRLVDTAPTREIDMAALWLGFWVFMVVLPVTAYLEWREERETRKALRKRGLTNAQVHEWIGHLDESN